MMNDGVEDASRRRDHYLSPEGLLRRPPPRSRPRPCGLLPINSHLPALVADVRERGGLVLVAEPGAGKTTRVPRALLDAGVAERGEPSSSCSRGGSRRGWRRAGSPTSSASRSGRRVGYRVRFEQKVSSETRVDVRDRGDPRPPARSAIPTLEGVPVVVFDELHERHLDADLALARAADCAQRGRPDLGDRGDERDDRGGAGRARSSTRRSWNVEGRAFPVDVRYAERPDDRPLERRVRAAVVRLLEERARRRRAGVPARRGRRSARRERACEGPAKAFGVDVRPAPRRSAGCRAGPRGAAGPAAEGDPPHERRGDLADHRGRGRGRRLWARARWRAARRGRGCRAWTRCRSASVGRAASGPRRSRRGPASPCGSTRKADHDARPLRDRPEIERVRSRRDGALAPMAAGEDPQAFA